MGKTRSTGFLNNLLSFDASGNITTTGTISASGGTVSYLPLSGGVLTGALTTNSTSGVSGIFKSNTFFGSIDLENTGGDVAGKWNLQAVSGAQVGATAGSSFGIYSYAASAYRLFITGAGNVGIGTTSPVGKLHIAGAVIINPNTIGTADIADRTLVLGSRASSANIASLGFDAGGTYRASIDFDKTTGNYEYWAYNGTTWSNRFTILENGRVGVGTVTPNSALNVVANSATNGLAIKAAGNGGTFPFRVTWSGGVDGDIFVITDTPRVGINTTSPQRSLDARGHVNLGTTAATSAGSGYSDVHLRTWSGATSSPAKIQVIDSWTDFYTTWTDGYRFRNYSADGVGRDLMVISSGSSGNGTIGAVTKPLQPAFKAGLSTSYTPGATTPIIFNHTTGFNYNIGGHYNTSNGRFTAPVSGRYVFTTCVIWQSLGSGQGMDDGFEIKVNGNTAAYSFRRAAYVANTTGIGGYYTDHATVMLNLSGGDYVEVVNRFAGLAVHGNVNYCWFNGYLLG